MRDYGTGFNKFLLSTAVLTIIILLVFVILQWLHLPSGHFVDWIIGIASFWWLVIIVTLPWNIHFQARQVLNEAAASREKGIMVKDESLVVAKRWVRRSLLLALALHFASAAILYALSWTGVSAVGYISAGAAILLTFLRPVVRGYDYLMSRLRNAETELRYPREDVLQLRNKMHELAEKVSGLDWNTDPAKDGSWAAQQQETIEELDTRLQDLRVAFAEMQPANSNEHRLIAREAQEAIARITVDSQFLDHVREIIRFFKNT